MKKLSSVCPKRILVLSGGGAKGAYSFGCLKAFKKMAIDFEAVAGTSVGALNAFIWSSNSMDKGEDLWRDLSFASIYPVRFLNPDKYPSWIIKFFSILFVISRLTQAAIQRIPVPGRTIWIFLFSTISSVPCFFIIFFLFDSEFNTILKIIFATFSFLSLFFGLQSDDHIKRNSSIGFYFTITSMCFDYSFMKSIYFFFPPIENNKILNVIIFTFSFLVVGLIMIISTLCFIGNLESEKKKDKTILNSAPLLDKLRQMIRNKSMLLPTFACLGQNKVVYNPDNPQWAPDFVTHSGRVPEWAEWEPILTKKWCPKYVRIDQLASEEAVKFCAASAALPFGIVAPINIDGQEYVDGGIIDNCPILSIYNIPEIEEIYIVLLDAFKNDEEAMKKSGISTKDLVDRNRLIKISNYPIPERVNRYHNVPSKKQNYNFISSDLIENNAKIILIYPKKSLGGWFSGTLNFSNSYAIKIMEEGYNDAMKKLSL